MGLSIEYMRDKIKYAPKYKNSNSWHAKVDNMYDNQVIAVYYRFLRAGEL